MCPDKMVRFGPPPFDLRPFVAEVVKQTGHFRLDAVDSLAEILTQLWPLGVSSSMLIYNDLEPMNDDHKAKVGAGRLRMPLVIWSMLSAAGRKDSHKAVKETTIGIVLAVQKERRRLAERAAYDN